MYLALEPAVRRYWPDSLLGWTRLLQGQILDARVGRDVLIGVAGGATIFLLLSLQWPIQIAGRPRRRSRRGRQPASVRRTDLRARPLLVAGRVPVDLQRDVVHLRPRRAQAPAEAKVAGRRRRVALLHPGRGQRHLHRPARLLLAALRGRARRRRAPHRGGDPLRPALGRGSIPRDELDDRCAVDPCDRPLGLSAVRCSPSDCSPPSRCSAPGRRGRRSRAAWPVSAASRPCGRGDGLRCESACRRTRTAPEADSAETAGRRSGTTSRRS